MEGECTSVPEVEELGWAAGSRVAVVGVAVGETSGRHPAGGLGGSWKISVGRHDGARTKSE